MNSLNALISVVNSLRAKGLGQLASRLDLILHKNAQELGDLGLQDLGIDADPNVGGEEPMGEEPAEEPAAPEAQPTETEVPDELAELQRTFFYQFEEWHRLIDRELPHFDYLGEDNINNLRHTFSNVHRALQEAMESRTADYSKDAAETFDAQLEAITRRLEESKRATINATKAKVDSALLYGTTKRLHDAFKRCCKNDALFAKANQEFDVLMRVFAMIIQNTAEEIAKTDLTEVR